MSEQIGRRALWGSITTGGGNIGGFLIRLIARAALARIIVPEDFGTFALAWSYAEIIGILGGVSFDQTLIQLKEGYDRLEGTVFWMTLAVFVLVFLVSLAFWPILAAMEGDAIADCFLLIAAVRIPSRLGNVLVASLHRAFRYHFVAGLQLLSVAVTTVVVLAMAAYNPSPTVLVVRDLLPQIFVLVVLTVVALRSGKASQFFGFDRRSAKAVWKLGRSLLWNRGFEVVYTEIDRLVVGHAFGERTLGFYDQARWLAGLPKALIAPIGGAVGLRTLSALHGDPERRDRAFDLTQYVITRVLMVMAIGTIVAPDLVVRVILGPDWLGAAEVLRWLSLWLVISPLSGNFKVLLFALQDFRPLYLAIAVEAATLSAAVFPLVIWFDAIGMALATTVATASRLIVLIIGASRTVTQGKGTYLPTILATVGAAGLGMLSRELTSAMDLVPSALLGLAVAYVTFLAATWLIERARLKAELRYIMLRLKRKQPAAPAPDPTDDAAE